MTPKHQISTVIWRPRLPAGLTLMLPALLLTCALFAVPLVRLAALSLGEHGFSARPYLQLIGPWSYCTILLRTFLLSLAVTLGCIVLGYPTGYLLAYAPQRVRWLLAMTALLPFWTSVLVRNFAWVYLLRDGGLISTAAGFVIGMGRPVQLLYSPAGVVIAMVNMLLPFMVFPVYIAIGTQDRDLGDVAQSLGASPSRVFLSITLPLSRYGLFAGSLLVFAVATGFFITPALLGGGRMTVAAMFIDQQIETFLDWPLAAAASMILLFVSSAIAMCGLCLAGDSLLRGGRAPG